MYLAEEERKVNNNSSYRVRVDQFTCLICKLISEMGLIDILGLRAVVVGFKELQHF